VFLLAGCAAAAENPVELKKASTQRLSAAWLAALKPSAISCQLSALANGVVSS
jgi:hypothetical protein